MNEQQELQSPSPNENTSIAASLFDYVEMFVFAAVAVIILLTFAVRLCVVSGPSMDQTLQNGERLLVSNLFYTPEAGDIIVFHQTSETNDVFNEPIVKRVIATGGQYVKIDYSDNKVFVSDDASFSADEAIDESDYVYLSGGKWKEAGYRAPEVYHVPEGHLFVMGDNRNVSADSRSSEISFVDERRVLGKVLCRLTPISKFGKVD